MRIGVIGGSFNPIHNGHLSIAQLALDYLNLEKIIFIPTKNHPHNKKSLQLSSQIRMSMIEMAIRDNSRFQLSTIEIEKQGTSFTIETIEELLLTNPSFEIFLIIGADNLESFKSWHRYEDILKNATLAVTKRPSFSITIPEGLDSSRIVEFPSPHWGISSSQIREYISRGLGVNYLVPTSVSNYIENNSIYNGEIDE